MWSAQGALRVVRRRRQMNPFEIHSANGPTSTVYLNTHSSIFDCISFAAAASMCAPVMTTLNDLTTNVCTNRFVSGTVTWRGWMHNGNGISCAQGISQWRQIESERKKNIIIKLLSISLLLLRNSKWIERCRIKIVPDVIAPCSNHLRRSHNLIPCDGRCRERQS